jgi:hypothetical protein
MRPQAGACADRVHRGLKRFEVARGWPYKPRFTASDVCAIGRLACERTTTVDSVADGYADAQERV